MTIDHNCVEAITVMVNTGGPYQRLLHYHRSMNDGSDDQLSEVIVLGFGIVFDEDISSGWCLRGYPIECLHFEEIGPCTEIIDFDLFLQLNEFCQGCPERLDYEGTHPDLAI
jgi:hypothetical protein